MDDVIVIGAGPAGTTAAWRLAERGMKVRIIEAESLPRVKPCGGALTHRILPLLPPGYEHQIKDRAFLWTFQGRGERGATISTTEPYCYMVERQFFDYWLSQEAVRRGAELHTNEPVSRIVKTREGYQVETASGLYRTLYLVGADGAKGVTAKNLGLNRPIRGAAIEAEIRVTDGQYNEWKNRVEIDVTRYPWGYAWIIPRYPILNVGVGSFRSRGLNLKSLFEQYFREKMGPLDNITPLAHPLPYRERWSPIAEARALLVGDAAGLMDPFSAEGIYSAIRTGHMAAEAIVQEQPGRRAGDIYTDQVKKSFWPNIKWARRMARLFYPWAGFWADVFTGNADLLNHYLLVAQGRSNYFSLVGQTEKVLLSRMKGRLVRGRNHFFSP